MVVKNIILWIIKIIVVGILLQTLYYKFSAHPDSVYIFQKTGLGGAGRVTTGIMELISAVLLLIPATAWMGALLTLGVMSGAIIFHLTTLGIEVNGDGGLLFKMAVIVFIGAFYILTKHWKDVFLFKKKFD